MKKRRIQPFPELKISKTNPDTAVHKRRIWLTRSASTLATKMTPAAAFTIMIVWIFFAEVGFMFLLPDLPAMPTSVKALIDGVTLLLIISPSYFLLYRPFKQNWEATRLKQLEITRLNHRLISSSEDEKRQLARDLHDEFGQILTGLQFEIQMVKQDIEDDPETARSQCNWISGQLTELSDRVRKVSKTLRPSMLDSVGLTATLRWLVKTVSGHQPGLNFNLEIPNERRLPAQIETVIYRICQEAINNICKHANADQVTILLQLESDQASLTVTDNGQGFEMKTLKQQAGEEGLGLVGMRERVVAYGGTLHVNSQPDEGCVIQARIPLTSEDRR